MIINYYLEEGKMKYLSIITILFLMFILFGCSLAEHQQPYQDMKLILNKKFDGKVMINNFVNYQEENDVLVVEIEHYSNYIKNIYISGKTLDILDAKAFGYTLNKIVIEEKEYFVVDLEDLEIGGCPSFLLELTFAKDSLYRDVYYEEIIKRDIAAHSFDIYINYDKEENSGNLQNYRFFLEANEDGNYDITQKIVIYNNLVDLLTYNGYYTKLFLPFSEDKVIEFSKEIIYYPNDGKILNLKTNNINLKVWVNARGIAYGAKEKTIYVRNGISYTIIYHDNANNGDFSIDFNINETDKIQYSYMIEDTSIEEVKAFIDSIKELG